ncbi:MAG: hypothetical protein BGO31_06870 [Bacteroidetes bacterium 43-16]|nr:MAG: hypothetical protein BGO31_06870 [Bacteroidetes bacterium 43-16]
MAASVAQEFYKLREEWHKIDKIDSWKIAVWEAEYPDVDIIDKFMEVERSPIGIFDDIFFRFESIYPGDDKAFAAMLWQEYLEWFEPVAHPEKDILQALLDAGLLTEAYKPAEQLEQNLSNLWQELLRLRAAMAGFNARFVLYFPIVPYNNYHISDWFQKVMQTVPEGLRLVTMDFARDKRLNLYDEKKKGSIVYLRPVLDMPAAINNEMKKSSSNYNTMDVHARYRQQIIVLMETTTVLKNPKTGSEVKKLLQIAQEIGTPNAIIGSLLIASQANYAINQLSESNAYADRAIDLAEEKMDTDPNYYHMWKTCVMIKAAVFTMNKAYKEALVQYEKLATKASAFQDVYYAMEARRLAALIYYERKDYNLAFEYLLLALLAGAYMDIEMRRNSLYIHVAYLALELGAAVRPKPVLEELKLQIEEWLGADWETLLQQEGVAAIKTKSKKPLFNFKN